MSFTPHTFRVLIEGIAENFVEYPHVRAFIETDSDSPAVLMTVNEVSEPTKIDFQNAMGGTRIDDGRTGILVYMRLTGTPRMGDAVTFTVWQRGAEFDAGPEPVEEEHFDSSDPLAVFHQGPIDFARPGAKFVKPV